MISQYSDLSCPKCKERSYKFWGRYAWHNVTDKRLATLDLIRDFGESVKG